MCAWLQLRPSTIHISCFLSPLPNPSPLLHTHTPSPSTITIAWYPRRRIRYNVSCLSLRSLQLIPSSNLHKAPVRAAPCPKSPFPFVCWRLGEKELAFVPIHDPSANNSSNCDSATEGSIRNLDLFVRVAGTSLSRNSISTTYDFSACSDWTRYAIPDISQHFYLVSDHFHRLNPFLPLLSLCC